jgi:hypothetical protein
LDCRRRERKQPEQPWRNRGGGESTFPHSLTLKLLSNSARQNRQNRSKWLVKGQNRDSGLGCCARPCVPIYAARRPTESEHERHALAVVSSSFWRRAGVRTLFEVFGILLLPQFDTVDHPLDFV